MSRPTNFPDGYSLADFQGSFEDPLTLEVIECDLPDERPTCACCGSPGDDNWWHIVWDDQTGLSSAYRSAVGTISEACANRLVGEANKEAVEYGEWLLSETPDYVREMMEEIDAY